MSAAERRAVLSLLVPAINRREITLETTGVRVLVPCDRPRAISPGGHRLGASRHRTTERRNVLGLRALLLLGREHRRMGLFLTGQQRGRAPIGDQELRD